MRVLRAEGGQILRGGRELVRSGAPIWIDLPPTAENLAFLAETFRFHPLALEDCAHEDQRVKLDQYPESLFAVIHRVALAPDDSEVVTLELNAFLTPDALVTVHAAPLAEVDAIFARCAAEPELLGRGPDFALYLVHDAITDAHFTLMDAMTAEVEGIADQVLTHAGTAAARDDLLDEIVAARRAHTVLRKRLSPQREVFAGLARPGQPQVRDATAIYFRDVVDHCARLTEEIDTGRDLLASAMDAYLSHTNNRLSEVMTRLTLISTIFLPLNFLGTFFGMNLQIVPPHLAIPLVLASMAAMPVGMWAIFKRKRWL